MSYANMILYSAVLPNSGEKKEDEGTINADKDKNWFKRMTGQ